MSTGAQAHPTAFKRQRQWWRWRRRRRQRSRQMQQPRPVQRSWRWCWWCRWERRRGRSRWKRHTPQVDGGRVALGGALEAAALEVFVPLLLERERVHRVGLGRVGGLGRLRHGSQRQKLFRAVLEREGENSLVLRTQPCLAFIFSADNAAVVSLSGDGCTRARTTVNRRRWARAHPPRTARGCTAQA